MFVRDESGIRSLAPVVLTSTCVRLYFAVTVNMMMSASDDYVGGGTYFVDLQQRIVLERGEFLLHPGHAIHAGCEITAGTRYLLVSFVHFV
jgi:predicted 2-oxoglutarate/Fe(II)-dependent dioxygenase YbiX